MLNWWQSAASLEPVPASAAQFYCCAFLRKAANSILGKIVKEKLYFLDKFKLEVVHWITKTWFHKSPREGAANRLAPSKREVHALSFSVGLTFKSEEKELINRPINFTGRYMKATHHERDKNEAYIIQFVVLLIGVKVKRVPHYCMYTPLHESRPLCYKPPGHTWLAGLINQGIKSILPSALCKLYALTVTDNCCIPLFSIVTVTHYGWWRICSTHQGSPLVLFSGWSTEVFFWWVHAQNV